MSGHSKWATIKRQKEAADHQRGYLFSKLSKEISIAARDGMDPETNFKLRLAIEKAKQANMPKENILRAIQRGGGGGKEGGNLQEMTFEGYGPGGVAVIVEAVADNKNRVTAEIKNLFERGGGSLAGPGAVAYLFKKAGLIIVEKTETIDQEVLQLIDLGAEDVEEVEDGIEVYVSPEQLKEAKDKIEQSGFKIKQVELIMKPTNLVSINDPNQAEKVLRFMEALESHEDVQKVYTNFDIPREVLEKLK